MILFPWVLVSLPSPPLHPFGQGLVTVLLCLPWALRYPSWSHRPGLHLCGESFLVTRTGMPSSSGGRGAEGYRKGLGPRWREGHSVWPIPQETHLRAPPKSRSADQGPSSLLALMRFPPLPTRSSQPGMWSLASDTDSLLKEDHQDAAGA